MAGSRGRTGARGACEYDQARREAGNPEAWYRSGDRNCLTSGPDDLPACLCQQAGWKDPEGSGTPRCRRLSGGVQVGAETQLPPWMTRPALFWLLILPAPPEPPSALQLR